MFQLIQTPIDGTREELDHFPELAEMQAIVGGWIEHVRVLDYVGTNGPVYTSMFVNEEGLLKNLPRNEAATEIYQRNVRHHFAGHENPFQAAADEVRKQWEGRGMAYIDATPKDALAAGYATDPFVVGPAIYFQGYTVEEINER